MVEHVSLDLDCLYSKVSGCANVSHVMRKPAFCKCKNKVADQLRSNHATDQRLCFCYTDIAIPLLPKSELQPSNHLLWLYRPGCVRPGWKSRR